MLEHAREAAALVQGKTREELDDDRVRTLALVRLLEIIGEAAWRVPDQIRSASPAIPWGEIIGLRNRLIHGYDAVDLDILWQILQHDVPSLIAELERVVPPQSGP